jgi:hypothetical protein
MRVLSDKIEFVLLLEGRGEEPVIPLLKGSIWAWDGKNFKVTSFCSPKVTVDLVICSSSQNR